MARKGFDEPWMPFAELAVGTANPVLGAGLAATRIAVNNAGTRKSKESATGIYYLLIGIGGLAFLSWLMPPPENQTPRQVVNLIR
jgi:hypothetical protein